MVLALRNVSPSAPSLSRPGGRVTSAEGAWGQTGPEGMALPNGRLPS
jgi:hypothetical protein